VLEELEEEEQVALLPQLGALLVEEE